MNIKWLVKLGSVAAALLALAACYQPEPKAPKTGKVTAITIDSRACYDKDTETVLLTYRPAGTDKSGDLWPEHPVCITPEAAAKYKVGLTYP